MREHLENLSKAESNLLSGAVYLAENIKSPDGYAEAVREIIPRFLEKNEVDLAAQLADSIEDTYLRDRLLSDVAEKCAELDDDEYALQLADAIEDFNYQALARERLAAGKAAKGEFDKAFEIAETLPHPSEVLAEIAGAQARSGDETSALETVSRIEYHTSKVNALQSVAARYQEQGDSAKAEELLAEAAAESREIELDEEKIRALLSIAESYIQGKRLDKAIEILGSARGFAETLDSSHRDTLLTLISLDFFRAGSIDLADRTLDLVEDKTQIASCLTGFSTIFNDRGERDEALEALGEAYALLKSQTERDIRDSRARFSVFTAVAVRYALFEKPERAIEIALENPLDEERYSALSQIARVCALNDQADWAHGALDAIEEESYKVFALIAVSDEKNKAGKQDEAIEYLTEAEGFAESIPQLVSRSQVYSELAKRFFNYGDPEKAHLLLTESLKTVNHILDESHKAVALARLSKIYEESDFQPSEEDLGILQAMVRKSEL